ncbi:MAG: ATP-binding protein [Candidatus Promineifilaceae bacterium]
MQTTKAIDIETMNADAWSVRYHNSADAEMLAKHALRLAQRLKHLKAQGIALRTLSYCASVSGKYEEALLLGGRAMDLLQVDEVNVDSAEMARIISRVYWNMGDHASALEYNLMTLEWAERTGNRQLTAHTSLNSALNLVRLGRMQAVEPMLHQALVEFEAIEDVRGMMKAYNNLAMLHLTENRIEVAQTFANKGWRLAVWASMVDMEVDLLDTLGQVAIAQGDYDSALNHFSMASMRAIEHNLPQAACDASLYIGRIYLNQQAFDDAKQEAKRALTQANALNNLHAQYQCHKLLADIASKQGEFTLAYQHHQQFHSLHASVFNDARDAKFASLEVRYRTESAQREAGLLREKTLELEDEIHERKRIERALVRAKEIAEIANRAKSRFIANMSHELRTPLNGILGYAQLLVHDATLSEKQRTQVGVMKQSGHHLLTLINDILDISKIEAKRTTLYPAEMHLNSFLMGIAAMMQMNAVQRDLQLVTYFDTALPVLVNADEKRLRQVLLNLLGNAIKFTSSGKITFEVSAYESHDPSHTRIRFLVRDTGIGIASADLKNIFQAFEQAGSETQRRGGTGLGLTISQALVQAMGGRLEVRSELGVGSEFWFDVVLPSTRSSTSLQSPEKSQRAIGYQGDRQHVLLVDDDPIGRGFLTELLSSLGFIVHPFSSGHASLAYAHQQSIDVAIIDFQMPKMRGDEVAQRLQAIRNVPLIAFSASMHVIEDGGAELELFDAFVPKPIQTELLLAALQDLLGLEWVYETRVIEKSAEIEDIIPPDTATLEQYLDMTNAGDLLRLQTFLDELAAKDKQYKAFVALLTPFIRDFDDEALTRHLQEMLARNKF